MSFNAGQPPIEEIHGVGPRMEAIRELQEMAEVHLYNQHDSVVVIGEGDPTSPLSIMGEALGSKEEDERGVFRFDSGELLNFSIGEAGLKRQDLWLTNAVKYRPTKLDGTKRVNRTPSKLEIYTNRDIVQIEMQIVRPKVIVALGATPVVTLYKPSTMKEVEGKKINLIDPFASGPIIMIASYHPGYYIRRGQFKSPEITAILELAKSAAGL